MVLKSLPFPAIFNRCGNGGKPLPHRPVSAKINQALVVWEPGSTATTTAVGRWGWG